MDLKTFRESRGLSQEQVASDLGLKSKGYISSLETGAFRCPLRVALRIERWSDGAVRAADLVEAEDAALLQESRSRPLPAGQAA